MRPSPDSLLLHHLPADTPAIPQQLDRVAPWDEAKLEAAMTQALRRDPATGYVDGGHPV